MNIPYVNLALQHQPIKKELLDAIESVIDSGRFILGQKVNKFERRFAELCGVKYAVGVNTGTDALILALRALGVGKNDEIITVSNSYISSSSCIVAVGARPVFIDVRDDYCIDPYKIEEKITSKTKAILPVHLTGRPADMDAITSIAKNHNLEIIEDCAQAVLAEFNGQRVGSFGTFGCFSLHPMKTLNCCGDGGVITTNEDNLYEKLLLLRDNGLESRNKVAIWSRISRLDEIQAAILLVKMKYVEEWTKKRIANARYYQQNLEGISHLIISKDKTYEKSVYHTFVIMADHRDQLQNYLKRKGIGTAIHYPIPIHLQEAAKPLGYSYGSLPVTEMQAKKILSLPVYPELNRSQINYIIESIHSFYN